MPYTDILPIEGLKGELILQDGTVIDAEMLPHDKRKIRGTLDVRTGVFKGVIIDE